MDLKNKKEHTVPLSWAGVWNQDSEDCGLGRAITNFVTMVVTQRMPRRDANQVPEQFRDPDLRLWSQAMRRRQQADAHVTTQLQRKDIKQKSQFGLTPLP